MSEETPRGLTLEPDRSSRHSVGIHASPAEVWVALTDPRELARWFVSEASIDLRPGGAYRWVFGEATGVSGADASVESGEFETVVPHEHLRARCSVREAETALDFRLDPWRDGTIVTVTHSGFPGEEPWDETFRLIDQGWDSEMQILKLYLERARGMVRRSFYHQAHLDAGEESIFEMLTTAAGLSRWLADRAAADPTLGGDLRLEWSGRAPVAGHFVAWDPDRWLAMTWESGGPSVVRVWIDPDEGTGGADVSLEHRLFAPGPGAFAPFDWDAALGRLARAVGRER